MAAEEAASIIIYFLYKDIEIHSSIEVVLKRF